MKEFNSKMRNCGNKSSAMQIIAGFQKKGWALYPAKKVFQNLNELEDTIKCGKEKSFLDPNLQYTILPLIKDHTNFKKISLAVEQMYCSPYFTEFNRGKDGASPFEMFEKGELPKPIAVHPLDSIVFNENLVLVVDKRLYDEFGLINPYPFLKNPCIEINQKDIPNAMMCINRYANKN